MEDSRHPLQVFCNGKESLGSFHYQYYSTKDAVVHGVLMTVLALVAAAMTIAIPLIHFITVPVGIVLSPLVGIYFFFARKGKAKCVIGDFTCPECQAENRVMTSGVHAEYSGKCHQCESEYRLVPLATQGPVAEES